MNPNPDNLPPEEKRLATAVGNVVSAIICGLALFLFLGVILFASCMAIVNSMPSEPVVEPQIGNSGISVDGDFYDVCCGKLIVSMNKPDYPVITTANVARKRPNLFEASSPLLGKFEVHSDIPLEEGPIIPEAWRDLPDRFGVRVSLMSIHEWANRMGIVVKRVDSEADIPDIQLLVNGVELGAFEAPADNRPVGLELPILFDTTSLELRIGDAKLDSVNVNFNEESVGSDGAFRAFHYTLLNSAPTEFQETLDSVVFQTGKPGANAYNSVELIPEGARFVWTKENVVILAQPVLPKNGSESGKFLTPPDTSRGGEAVVFRNLWRFSLEVNGFRAGEWKAFLGATAEGWNTFKTPPSRSYRVIKETPDPPAAPTPGFERARIQNFRFRTSD